MLLLTMPAAVFSFDGPLQIKNQFPLFTHIAPPYLESALPEDSFSLSVSHSSVFMLKDSREWSVQLDLEVTELSLRYRKIIPDLFELGVEVPVLDFSSGFMDGMLNNYHNSFGFPDYGRGSRPDNKFLYELRKNGALIVKAGSGRAGIGDVRLTAKKLLLSGQPAVSLKADIEFPTGDAARGFGSGGLDTGISLLIDKQLSEWVKVYCNLGAVFPGDLKADKTIRLRNFMYLGGGIEATPWDKFSFVGQILFHGSPYPIMGIGVVDRTAALLSLGLRYSGEGQLFEFSLTEDPNTAGAPDIIFSLAYKKRF